MGVTFTYLASSVLRILTLTWLVLGADCLLANAAQLTFCVVFRSSRRRWGMTLTQFGSTTPRGCCYWGSNGSWLFTDERCTGVYYVRNTVRLPRVDVMHLFCFCTKYMLLERGLRCRFVCINNP